MIGCIDLYLLFGVSVISSFIFLIFGFMLLIGAKPVYKYIGVATLFVLILTAVASAVSIKVIGHKYEDGVLVDTGSVVSISDNTITIRSDNSNEYEVVGLSRTVYGKSVGNGRYELRRFGNSVFYIDHYFIKE